MKYVIIVESDIDNKAMVEFVRTVLDTPPEHTVMYIGEGECEHCIEEFINAQQVAYELKKRKPNEN